MQFRLRYLAHDFELPPGEFFIGRSDECQLALDDPLVSRRHAILRVTPGRVTLVDLGSRNGVAVNGHRITVERFLKHGDKVTIGGQEMVLHVVTAQETVSAGRELSRTLGDISLADVQHRGGEAPPIPRPDPEVQQASTHLRDIGAWAEEASRDGDNLPEEPPRLPPPKAGRLDTTFRLLSGVADKALGMGRSEEAERMLSPILAEILAELERGRPVDDAVVNLAVAYAVKIAAGTGKGIWVDYVFQVHLQEKRLLPAPIVDELHTVVRRVKQPSLRIIRDYLAAMRQKQTAFSPTERFLLQRVEGIEQLCALK